MADPGYLVPMLAWLQEHVDPKATAITKVTPTGNDYAGDTFQGFHGEFDVEITYKGFGGSMKRFGVDGDDMESLWRAVVGEPWEAP